MNIESFINTSNFILENIDVQKANGAVKLFQGNGITIPKDLSIKNYIKEKPA